MADVLVVGKKISDMDLVSDITGVEKIPTDVAGDKAVTTGQLLTYLDLNGSVQWGKITGDLSNQSDLLNKFNLQTSELQLHASNYNNPHEVTATQVGLGNVDNTADLDKPVSTATQTALLDLEEKLDLRISTFNTIEEGLLYTKNLEYFKVPTLSGGVFEKIYQNISNSAIPQSSYAVDPDHEWNAAQIQYGTLNQNEVNDGVDSIQDLLDIANPFDGMRIYVRGYHTPTNLVVAQPYVGGGVFVYKSSLVGTNNGVNLFNGWVRILTSSTLTTHDAGLLGDGTDINSAERITTLLRCCSDSFTVKLIGTFNLNTNIFAQGLSGLKVDGSACNLVGQSSSWVWKTTRTTTSTASANGSTEYYQRGLLCFFECPHIEVFGFNITGVQLSNDVGLSGVDPWQDGDVGIQFHMCYKPVAHHNNVTHTFAWGIHATSSIGATIYSNRVTDVAHQSGVNVVMDMPENSGEVVSIYNNTIHGIALYGIELENYYGNFVLDCYGNTVHDCFGGLVQALGATSSMRASIRSNNIYNTYFGMWMPHDGSRVDQSVSIDGNNVKNFYRGIYYQNNTSNHKVLSNNVEGRVVDNFYQRRSADLFVIKVVNSNSFIVQKSTFELLNGPNGTWYIDGVAFTVSSIVDSSYSMGTLSTSGQLIQVTVNEGNVQPNMLHKHLTRLVTTGSRAEAGIHVHKAQTNMQIQGNIVSGCQYNYFKESGNPVVGNELVLQNRFTDAGISNIYFQSTDITNVQLYAGQVDESSGLTLNRGLLESGNFKLSKTRVLEITTAKTAGSPATEYSYVNYSTGTIIGVFVEFVGGSTTGNVTCRVAVTSDATATSHSAGTTSQLIAFDRSVATASGLTPIYVTLSSTANDLAYTSSKITLIYA